MRKIKWLETYLLSQIEKISIFQYLDEEEKKILLKYADFLEYYDGERIITQGEVGRDFFAIISGTVKVSVNGENGKQIQLSTINEGDFFGETGIFNDSKRTANVIAIDTVQVVMISRDYFFSFIRMYPKAGVKLLMLFVNSLIKKLNASNKELADEREVLEKIPFFEKQS